jgi:hypothetical protein
MEDVMTLAERVEKSLKEGETVRENKRSFKNLRDFYDAMKKEGGGDQARVYAPADRRRWPIALRIRTAADKA